MPVENGKWRQIFKECFGLKESDIYKAKYDCGLEGLEGIILRLLVSWKQRQSKPTRKQLFKILMCAKGKGICKDIAWCEFLVSGQSNDMRSTGEEEVGVCKAFLIREFNNVLYWDMMIRSLAFHLFYTKIEVTLEPALFSIFILPLTIYGDYGKLIPFGKYISNFVMMKILGTKVTRPLPIYVFGYLVTILNIAVAVIWGNTAEGYILNLSIYLLFVAFIMGQTMKTSHQLSFHFITNKQITAAHSHQPDKFHILLNFLTWPLMGKLLGHLIAVQSGYRLFINMQKHTRPATNESICEIISFHYYADSIVMAKLVPPILACLGFIIWSLAKMDKPLTWKTALICVYQFISLIIGTLIQIFGISLLLAGLYVQIIAIIDETQDICKAQSGECNILTVDSPGAQWPRPVVNGCHLDTILPINALIICDIVSLVVLNIYRMFELSRYKKKSNIQNFRRLMCFLIIFVLNALLITAFQGVQTNDNHALFKILKIQLLYPFNTFNRGDIFPFSEIVPCTAVAYIVIAQFVLMAFLQNSRVLKSCKKPLLEMWDFYKPILFCNGGRARWLWGFMGIYFALGYYLLYRWIFPSRSILPPISLTW